MLWLSPVALLSFALSARHAPPIPSPLPPVARIQPARCPAQPRMGKDAAEEDSDNLVQAILRLIRIEGLQLAEGLKTAKPAPAMEQLRDWTESRRPLLQWSFGQMAKKQLLTANSSGLVAPELEPLIHEARYHARANLPNLSTALAVLMPQIRAQLGLGLRASPFACFRLAYRVVLLVAFSWLAKHVPVGARPTHWVPRCLERVAITLEKNHGKLQEDQQLAEAIATTTPWWGRPWAGVAAMSARRRARREERMQLAAPRAEPSQLEPRFASRWWQVWWPLAGAGAAADAEERGWAIGRGSERAVGGMRGDGEPCLSTRPKGEYSGGSSSWLYAG